MNKKLIKEGAEKALAAKHGYDVYSEGKWYKTEEDAKKKRGGLTSDQLWNKFGKSEKTWVSGDPDSDPDFKGGNRYEEVEYIMNLLEKREKSFDLFPKNDERLLREYIREQYEARGIYPTAREVQETFNQVMSLLEKVSAEEKARREALRYGGKNKRQARREARTGRPDDSGNVEQISRDEGERQGAHSARRRKPTKISSSSPARQESPVEIATRRSGMVQDPVGETGARGSRNRQQDYFKGNRGVRHKWSEVKDMMKFLARTDRTTKP
jgi:hypothetical protein